MMKKKILSLAVTAGLVGAVAVSTAQAQMHINDKGLGEALIYPFYSAANGNDTYVHVVNTTDYGKAVKVRFIEAMNSKEVLDFNLYLSPEDVWAGVITKNPNGDGAMIRTVDTSCTVPLLGSLGGGSVATVNGKTQRDQPFVNTLFAAAPETDTSVERTLEGYIEVIEMGQMPVSTPNSYGWFAEHTTAGVPRNCGELVDAWSTGGPWFGGAPNTDFDATWDATSNAGGLYGFGVVINVPEGTAVGYDAVAIDNFRAAGQPNLHVEPGDENPSLTAAQPQATIFNGPAATTYTFSTGTDAVSALLMTSNISNDFVTDPAINATTDWVVTMPTKRFYVDLPAPVTTAAYLNPANPPFLSKWNPAAVDGAVVGACEPIAMQFWDREEANVDTSTGPVFSPRPTAAVAPDLNICREVNVISFSNDADASALNATSRVLHGINPGYSEGWAQLSFERTDLNATTQANITANAPGARTLVDTGAVTTFHGLPVAGFAVFNYQNGEHESGALANYAAGTEHKSEIRITP